jgi:hypothetical protein
MSTASTDELGDIHASLTATYKRLISPREEVMVVKGEVLLDDLGNPRTITVYPTAAELQAANAFLRDNKITAAAPEGSALDELHKLAEKRRSKRRDIVADPYANLPPLQ